MFASIFRETNISDMTDFVWFAISSIKCITSLHSPSNCVAQLLDLSVTIVLPSGCGWIRTANPLICKRICTALGPCSVELVSKSIV